MKTLLLTGFEPFAGETINASAEVVRHLHGEIICGQRVEVALLPCVFAASVLELRHQIRTLRPALVVCVGQAEGRAEITPERVAINVDDARIPDNEGQQPMDSPIVRGGPAAYWSTLPIKAIVTALRDRRIPAAVSQTAGTFVCNHVFYGLMHTLRRQRRVRGGFVHVPILPSQAKRGKASLPLATSVEALRIVLTVAIKTRRDERSVGGATH